MFRRLALVVLAWCCAIGSLGAQAAGVASGKGTIDSGGQPVAFAPRFAWACAEGKGAKRSTWIVLTEKEPPAEKWAAAKDRPEARRRWCEKEKASFVAVKLDAAWKVDLYFLCPANGAVNTEMLSTWNGLDSVVLTFDNGDPRRLKGTLRTGAGSCPGPDGTPAYCTPTGDYAFEAPLVP